MTVAGLERLALWSCYCWWSSIWSKGLGRHRFGAQTAGRFGGFLFGGEKLRSGLEKRLFISCWEGEVGTCFHLFSSRTEMRFCWFDVVSWALILFDLYICDNKCGCDISRYHLCRSWILLIPCVLGWLHVHQEWHVKTIAWDGVPVKHIAHCF